MPFFSGISYVPLCGILGVDPLYLAARTGAAVSSLKTAPLKAAVLPFAGSSLQIINSCTSDMHAYTCKGANRLRGGTHHRLVTETGLASAPVVIYLHDIVRCEAHKLPHLQPADEFAAGVKVAIH